MNNKNMIVDSYTVTKDTYIIEPIIHEDKIFSRIYDKSGEVIVSNKPLYVIRRSCRNVGNNFNFARQISKNFFGEEKHKLPIIISFEYGIPSVFFPILSPFSPNNIWVGINGIINIRRDGNNTEITLKDGREVMLQINYSSFCVQYVCAMMLFKHAQTKRLDF